MSFSGSSYSCESDSCRFFTEFLSGDAVYRDESDSEYVPDSISLTSDSIQESDGEDPLHCLLPPLHPDLIDGALSLVEGPVDDSEELLEEMRQNPSIVAQRREFLMPSQETGRSTRCQGSGCESALERTSVDKSCNIM